MRTVVLDPQLGLDYSRVVHGEEKFVYSRPIGAGDELVVSSVIDNIRAAAGNDMITVRSDIATVTGEHVVTTYSLTVARGTA
jgi:acyl dehydratase